MANLTYDFDYSEIKQNEIIRKIESYTPLLENLVSCFYPDLKFLIKCSLSQTVNLFAGYYEPKIEIIAENIEYNPMFNSYSYNTTLKIKDTDSVLNGVEFCESIYSYLPDVLYYTSLIIKNGVYKDFEWDFEEYALKKEVLSKHNTLL